MTKTWSRLLVVIASIVGFAFGAVLGLVGVALLLGVAFSARQE